MDRYPEHWGTCAAPPGTRAFDEWVAHCAEDDEAGIECRAQDAPRMRVSVRESVRKPDAAPSAAQLALGRLARVWDDSDEYQLDD